MASAAEAAWAVTASKPAATIAPRDLWILNIIPSPPRALPLLGSSCRTRRGYPSPTVALPAEDRFADRARHRLRRLDDADDRHSDEEVGEVVEGEHAGPGHVHAFGRLGAQVSERQAGEHEQPEKPAIERAVLRGANTRRVEPRDEHQDDDRAEHRDHAAE